MNLRLCATAALALASFAGDPARAAGLEYTLAIQNHRFEPEQLDLPAGQKIALRIVNADTTPEEFESDDLHREKVVAGNSAITVFVGPLRPGTYRFFGDFHPQTARGRLLVR